MTKESRPAAAETAQEIKRLAKKHKLLPNEVRALQLAAEDPIGEPFEKCPRHNKLN